MKQALILAAIAVVLGCGEPSQFRETQTDRESQAYSDLVGEDVSHIDTQNRDTVVIRFGDGKKLIVRAPNTGDTLVLEIVTCGRSVVDRQ